MAMHGLLLLDKPAGPTSHDVVTALRRVLQTREIGHAGTLDPNATGLLVMAVGAATRWLPYLPGDKSYRAGIKLGIETDTEDVWGETIATKDASQLSAEEIKAALLSLTGLTEQVPPMVSALKKDGRTLHSLAREGKVVERAPRPVSISAVRVLAVRPGEADFEVDCGSGTYVRTLCAETGRRLGTGACMSSLRRLKSNGFDVAAALPQDQWNLEALQAALLDGSKALKHLPALDLDEAGAKEISHGRTVKLPEGSAGTWRLNREGRLVALAEAKDGLAHPRRVFETA
jgi:tRNA pseudouridine55 synthase